MPILPPLPRPQRRRIHKIIHATRDKGHARRLMAILLLHEVYRSSYHLTPASNRCLVYATLVRTSFGINFRPFLNML